MSRICKELVTHNEDSSKNDAGFKSGPEKHGKTQHPSILGKFRPKV